MNTENKPKDNFFTRIGKDFNKNYFFFLGFWLIACLLFSKPINSLLNYVGAFLFQYKQSFIYDLIVFISLPVILLLRPNLGKILKELNFKDDYVLKTLLFILVWYIPCRLGIEPKIDFISFNLLPFIKLIDIILLVFLIYECCFLNKERKRKKSKLFGLAVSLSVKQDRSKQSSFISDVAFTPSEREPKDLLGFEPYAKRIADEAMIIASPESVIFGINGEWGEGKTTMINLIKEQLKRGKYTVIDFHPWKTYSGKGATQLFFNVLKDGI